MNNRNKMIMTKEELKEYVIQMEKNALKHGVQLLFIGAGSICAGSAIGMLTKPGKQHPDATLGLVEDAREELLDISFGYFEDD